MANEGYNGYTNYETWAICLWIDNDQHAQSFAFSLAENHDLEDGSCAEAFKDWIHEIMPDLGATLWADLLNASLSEVNWQEVAKVYKEDE